MNVNGKWFENITCKKCRNRHPAELSCEESKKIADEMKLEREQCKAKWEQKTEMNANEQFDFYNPDSMYYANSKHYIAQLEAMSRQQQAEMEELKAAVRSFFNDYLDQREESDSGRVFAPIYISNCRCMTLDPMSKLMSKMRELSGAKPPPKGDW